MELPTDTMEIPLLNSSSRTTSTFQALANIIVSVVGTGVLGLPFAFRIAGYAAGSFGVLLVALATYYSGVQFSFLVYVRSSTVWVMKLINIHKLSWLRKVKCREKLTLQGRSNESKTYGDLGYICMGNKGRYLTEFLIFFAQCGGSVAYLVFIGQNLSSVFQGHGIPLSSYIFLIAAVEVVLSWIGSLAALAPFSIFADICNAIAMGIVVKEDIQKAIAGGISFNERTAITSNLRGLPFAGGMAVFCFEGFGMTLALQSSMKDKAAFPKVLGQALVGITIVYILFGFSGYMAYGDDTRDIITLNLPNTWSTKAVQVGLCVGLIFTFPIMLHPINEIVEGKLAQSNWFEKIEDNDVIFLGKRAQAATYMSRAVIVLVLAILASFVPAKHVMFLKLESWKKTCIFEEASIFVLEIEDFEESLDIQRSFNLRILEIGVLEERLYLQTSFNLRKCS
ncbi:amino acid transporter ANT1 [Cucumis melo var. makuwa]|uniref:Amino acid transporter ANT1 n=1 Tax=Cucumis melo var. makuwa TaxID=1194695 RepID=A0A5A7V2N0_CUCMM|nr:amino acid transporter ANT1 [Cucumis melo var. makuwa]